MKKNKKGRRGLFWSFLVLLLLACVGAYFGYGYYRWIYGSNTAIDGEEVYVHIPTEGDYEGLKDSLEKKGAIRNMESFDWVADLKGLPDRIHAGKYRIEAGMSNDALTDRFRGGYEETVRVSFSDVRNLEELAKELTEDVEVGKGELLELLEDPATARKYGFDEHSFKAMFIPNTYEFYWDVSAKELLDRMKKEYERFWTEEREEKAKDLGLDRIEVSILASIVEAEQMGHPQERPKIARLFLNRLKKGMRLESDPTLVYAIGDFSIKRVLDKDRDVESPYNTYRYKGLPPGPIRIPGKTSIEAVLNPDENDYLFMCARPDTTELHNFAETHPEHVRNARKYQRWLNQRKVFR